MAWSVSAKVEFVCSVCLSVDSVWQDKVSVDGVAVQVVFRTCGRPGGLSVCVSVL